MILTPPLFKPQKKTKQLHMLITKEEHAMLKAKSKKMGMTGVDFIRALIVYSEVVEEKAAR